MSSLMLLDYLWTPSQEIRFSGINCEITETTELLGVYPYQIDYDELTFPRVECDIKGDVVSKMVGHGFSYFVAPSITHEHDGLRVSMYGRIQYLSGKERNISEIYDYFIEKVIQNPEQYTAQDLVYFFINSRSLTEK